MTSFKKMPLHGGVHLMATTQPSGARKNSTVKQRPPSVGNWKVTETRHELLVDWSEIKDSSWQSTRAGFEHVMALCKATKKDELVVENIAPGYTVGRGAPTVVIEAQERIVSMFMQASANRFRELPEYRLSLRRGVFDLRFYLGCTRPTDFVRPDEDY